jgi:broad specificity phosphatase PhoE
MRFRRTAVFLLALLVGGLLIPSGARCQEETLIFLVRHAERADDGAMTGQEDPHLSEAGSTRAGRLAELLQDAGIDHVFSTNFIRTRETAAPTAEAAGVEIQLYGAGDPEAFATELWNTPGRHLVVGHSNSTPALVAALGGDPHGEIQPLEYDRLYLVTKGPDGVSTVLLRFGAPFSGAH